MANHRKRHNRKSAAAYINRCVSTLDKWRYERIVLPFYQDGRVIWYEKQDLDEYLASRRIEPVAYGCTERSRSDFEKITEENAA